MPMLGEKVISLVEKPLAAVYQVVLSRVKGGGVSSSLICVLVLPIRHVSSCSYTSQVVPISLTVAQLEDKLAASPCVPPFLICDC